MVADRGHQVEQGQPRRLLEPEVTFDDDVGGLPAPCPCLHGARRADGADTGILGFVGVRGLSKIRTVGDNAIDALVAPRVALRQALLAGCAIHSREERFRPLRSQQGGAGSREG